MCLEKTKLCLVTICPCKQMCVWVKNRMWRLRFKQQLWKCLCWLWWYKQCDSSQTLWRCGWTHRYPSLVSSHMLQYVRMGAINVVAGSLNSEEHLVSHTRFLCHCRQSCVFVCVCVCHSYISAGTPILHQFIYLQHIRISSFLHSLAKPAKGFNVMPESLILCFVFLVYRVLFIIKYLQFDSIMVPRSLTKCFEIVILCPQSRVFSFIISKALVIMFGLCAGVVGLWLLLNLGAFVHVYSQWALCFGLFVVCYFFLFCQLFVSCSLSSALHPFVSLVFLLSLMFFKFWPQRSFVL